MKLTYMVPSESEYNASVLKATNCINTSESEQRKTLLLVELMGIKPLIVVTEDAEQFHVLTHQTNIDIALARSGSSVESIWFLTHHDNIDRMMTKGVILVKPEEDS